jgi:hypothetical protein
LIIVGLTPFIKHYTAGIYILGKTLCYTAIFVNLAAIINHEGKTYFYRYIFIYFFITFMLTTGLKDGLIAIALSLIYYIYKKRSISLYVLIFAPIMTGVLMSAKFILRGEVLIGGNTINTKLNIIDYIYAMFNMFYTVFTNITSETFLAALDFFLIRSQYIYWYLVVIYDMPGHIPYQTTDFLSRFFISFIPGFLFDKPVDDKGQIFGHMFSLLGKDDFTTSANVPLLADLYIIGGITSIILFPIIYILLYKVYKYLSFSKNMYHYVSLDLLFLMLVVSTFDSGTSLIGGYFYALILSNLFIYILIKSSHK